MTPHWLVIEKLVVELGGVCAAQAHERHEPGNDTRVAETVDRATEAVTAVLRSPQEHDDAAVRTAWEAIAQAQDAIRELQATMDRSRTLCDAAQALQEHSLRLRRGR
jgi:hypothetical protein